MKQITLLAAAFIVACHAMALTANPPGGGTLARLVDLEIHTHTLSDNEISNLGHFIMDTFVNRTPSAMMVYSDKSTPYDVRLDVYVLKTPRLYCVFVQVFNRYALHQKLLAVGVSEEQAKPLLEGDNAIFGQDNTWVIGADSISHLKEDLSGIIDIIVSTVMPDIPGTNRILKSDKQHP
jgi:hypothetical protein